MWISWALSQTSSVHSELCLPTCNFLEQSGLSSAYRATPAQLSSLPAFKPPTPLFTRAKQAYRKSPLWQLVLHFKPAPCQHATYPHVDETCHTE